MSKVFVVGFCVLVAFGCAENRFKKNWDLNIFTFGFSGHDAFKFCRKTVPNFIAPYQNGINPSKTCIYYQYYTCHVNHYCNGDKKCEAEAAQFWLKPWRDLKTGQLLNPVEATAEICQKELKRNSAEQK